MPPYAIVHYSFMSDCVFLRTPFISTNPGAAYLTVLPDDTGSPPLSGALTGSEVAPSLASSQIPTILPAGESVFPGDG